MVKERKLAPNIPDSLALRYKQILSVGLPKKEREEILEKYPPPKNCIFFDPPKVNDEINVKLKLKEHEAALKRDSRLIEKQTKISSILSILGSVVSDIIFDKSTKKEKDISSQEEEQLEKISTSMRMLMDVQRDEALTRRGLILANIKITDKSVFESSSVDEYLFGEDLSEKLKVARSIEKASRDLSSKEKENIKSKNAKNPPRRPPFRARSTGGYNNNQTYNNNNNYNKNQFSKYSRPNDRTKNQFFKKNSGYQSTNNQFKNQQNKK